MPSGGIHSTCCAGEEICKGSVEVVVNKFSGVSQFLKLLIGEPISRLTLDISKRRVETNAISPLGT